MPTLNWIGKERVVNHHREVPYRVLERRYTFGGEADGGANADNAVNADGGANGGNMIVHGDNLEALKALLPQLEGQVDCIYIDPPYNTGNEGWVYNDNSDDPQLRRWLGEVVGPEGEDLSRHDKWLCMMYPRLRLLRDMLSARGAIFISIDNNEAAHLRLLCDEVFGAACFVNDVAWQRTYSPRNDSKGIVSEAEHLLVYSRHPGWQPNKLPRTEEMNAKYANPDGDVAIWRSDNAYAPNAATHQGMVYAIQHPFTGKMLYPAYNNHWRYGQEEMLDIMNGWCEYELRDLHDEERRAEVCGIAPDEVRKEVLGIVLKEDLETSRKKATAVLKKGPWPKYFFSKGGKGGIARKTYLTQVEGRVPTNLWPFAEVGHTDEAKKELMAIFGGRSPFDTPKPTRLVERILQIATREDSLVLDSFAGSGTTAHAVLRRNRADSGRRRFVLIEMMDYAESITAERVRRVIGGYGTGSRAAAPLGGGFGFYELGPALLHADGTLNEAVGTQRLREYVYYTETRQPLRRPQQADFPYLLDYCDGTGYFLCYEPHRPTTLGPDTLGIIPHRADRYVVYADRCTLSAERLARLGITFKKIPRDITRF